MINKQKREVIIRDILINNLIDIVKFTGMEALKIYNKDFSIEYKDDKSPLTEADAKVNEIICEFLEKEHNYPILSEENKQIDYEKRKNWEYYWCIDPIDGTKEFIKKNGEFTINIALIYKDTPILGIVYAPVLDKLYYAKKGEGAYLLHNDKKYKLPFIKKNEFIVVASKSHISKKTENFIENLKRNYDVNLESIGSSLKLCKVAEGSADIYPRIAPTMEWDTAAADAIVREAGKKSYIYEEKLNNIDSVEEIKNIAKSLKYNKENLLNPYLVVV